MSSLKNPYLDQFFELKQHPETAAAYESLAQVFRSMDSDGNAESRPAERDFLQDYAILSERRRLVIKYSFALPNTETIEQIAEYSPLIEIGPGTGYWADLLARVGAEIVAFDNSSWADKIAIGAYYKVQEGGSEKIEEYPDHTLMMVWPPYAEPMAEECLGHYKGDTIVFVGELDGACGTDAFCSRLIDTFELQRHPIPQWPMIHDYLYIGHRN